MSFVVSSLVDYIDQSSQDLLLPAVAQGVTATKVTIQPGIKSSAALQLFDSTVVFQDDDCAFNASGSTTFTQRNITVTDIKIQESLCPKDLEAKWTQLLLSAGSDYTEADIPAQYMTIKMERLQNALEVADWQGNIAAGVGNNSFYDGFLKVIDDSGAAVDGNPGAITVATGITNANALDVFQGVYESIPEALLNADDLLCFCGWDTYRKLIVNITDGNFFHYVSDDAAITGEMIFPGTNLRIVATVGLTGTNRIIAARASNMFIGMDAMSDSDGLEMWYSQDDRVVRSSSSFKRGTQFSYPAEATEFSLVP